MLSVLIPIYNVDVCNLVMEIHHQLEHSGIRYEIICIEDGSDTPFVDANLKLNNLPNTKHVIRKENTGRLNTRLELCDASKFEWLLFVDADTLPKSKNYISNYIQAIQPDTQAIFGGFAYYDQPPKQDFLLRWKYGRKYEVRPAKFRNKKPYKLIISANFMIRKTVIKSLDLSAKSNEYGHDSYFSNQLKANNIKVLHIDNEVYHLGIEESTFYLKKKEQAARTLMQFYSKGLMKFHENGLLNAFITLKKMGLSSFFAFLYKQMNGILRRRITGKNPSTFALQLYRLLYVCSIYHKGQEDMESRKVA